MIKYKPRIVDNLLKDKLAIRGAVLIEGPKWCGKTTTGMQFAKSVLKMDDPRTVKSNIYLASINPRKLLEGDTPRLIDEWQIAMQLWDAARFEIDRRSKKGQFIFSGSANPIDVSLPIHSGTGRFSRLTMRTMSLYESLDSTGEVSLKHLFSDDENISGSSNVEIDEIAYWICRGGWPDALDLNMKHALIQAQDYYESIIKTDINRVDGISKNELNVGKLMRSYARNQGGQTSASTLIADIGSSGEALISENSLYSYITALKNIFVIEDMQAWNPNLRSKTAIRTSDTRYFSDPAIATAALGIGPKDLINDLETFGLLFETLCVRDLRVYAQANNGKVYHYRDSSGLECDCVVHLRNGKYGLVEIKLGGDLLIEEGVKNLKKLEKKIDTKKMNKPSFMMVLTGLGPYAYKRDDGICVVPIGCLKN